MKASRARILPTKVVLAPNEVAAPTTLTLVNEDQYSDLEVVNGLTDKFPCMFELAPNVAAARTRHKTLLGSTVCTEYI